MGIVEKRTVLRLLSQSGSTFEVEQHNLDEVQFGVGANGVRDSYEGTIHECTEKSTRVDV